MKSLTTLRMVGNSLGQVDLDLSGLTKLQRLDLRCNELTKIGPLCVVLPALRSLLLRKNYLRDLPELSPLVELQELLIGDNQFNVFPPTIATLTSLR
mgnify:FL=1